MQPPNYNELLQYQIQKTFGDRVDIPENFQVLLQQISDTYGKHDEEHKQLEAKVALRTEQLIASTSRAYSFLDSLNMGFIMCDVIPEVVLTNLSLKQMLASKTVSGGAQPAQPLDAKWDMAALDAVLQPELQFRQLVLKSLETNQPIVCEEVNFGKLVLRFYIAPMINEVSQGDKQKIGVVILVEDITEQKVLEHSKDDFLSIASHELRTPLTAIRGNAALIKKYYLASLNNQDLSEMVDDIHESCVRLINIVNDFLDVSSLEQGKIIMNPEELSPKEVADDVIHELQNLCDAKGIALICDQSVDTSPAVTADRQRIKQVLYNLVGNAVKFTDKGSITISAQTEDNFVNIVVTDTGRGMSAENQRLLFRKFQQAGSSLLTRDTTKGTGLGLYISKLIVELSGGKIKLERSEPGQGSSFVFSLPRTPSSV